MNSVDIDLILAKRLKNKKDYDYSLFKGVIESLSDEVLDVNIRHVEKRKGGFRVIYENGGSPALYKTEATYINISEIREFNINNLI